MELINSGNCKLCGENTATLTSKSISADLENGITSFYKKEEVNFKYIEQENRKFCVLCTHKILLAFQFKCNYEESFQKHRTVQKNRNTCMFCRVKTADVIKTEDNPNDFEEKVKVFMDVTLFPRPFLQSGVCCSCLFYLCLWFEMNSHIKKKINFVVKQDDPLETPAIEVEDSDCNSQISDLQSGKENITPTQSVNQSSNNKQTKLSLKKTFTLPITNKNENYDDVDHGKDISKTLREHLKHGLHHLTSLKQMHPRGKLSEDIENDKKMFTQVPYVLISGTANHIDTKVTDQLNRNRVKRKSRFLNNFGIRRRLRRTVKQRNYKTMHTVGVIEISDTESERSNSINMEKSKSFSSYCCGICDKVVNTYCDYKKHNLWHEKPQDIIINIIRHDLPTYTRASQFKQPGLKQISQEELGNILQKYVDLSDEEPTNEPLNTKISTSDNKIDGSSNDKSNKLIPVQIITSNNDKSTPATEITSNNDKDAEEKSKTGNENIINGNDMQVTNNSKNENCNSNNEENVEEKGSTQNNISSNEEKVEEEGRIQNDITTNEEKVKEKGSVQNNISTNEEKVEEDRAQNIITTNEKKAEGKGSVQNNISTNEEKVEEDRTQNIITANEEKAEGKGSVQNNISTNEEKVEEESTVQNDIATNEEKAKEKGTVQNDKNINNGIGVLKVGSSSKNNIDYDSRGENVEDNMEETNSQHNENIDSNNRTLTGDSNTETINNAENNQNSNRNGIDKEQVTSDNNVLLDNIKSSENKNQTEVNTHTREKKKGFEIAKELTNIGNSSMRSADNEKVTSADKINTTLKSVDSSNSNYNKHNEQKECFEVSSPATEECNTSEISAIRKIITSGPFNNEIEENEIKRKRSHTSDSDTSDTSLTPKTKRVRFATAKSDFAKMSDEEINLLAVLES